MSKPTEILLGQKVKCIITGLQGIVEHRAIYMHGCARVGIALPVQKDGKIPDTYMADEPQIKVVDAKRVIEVDAPSAKYVFGQTAKDPITGFEGTYTGRAVYLNGCARIMLTPKLLKGEVKESQWFPEERIVPVGKVLQPPKVEAPRRTGGPQDRPQRDNGPSRRDL